MIFEDQEMIQRGSGCALFLCGRTSTQFKLKCRDLLYGLSYLVDLVESVTAMDEILEILKKTASRTQKLFDEGKDPSLRRIESCDKTLKSEESSEAQKVQASLMKMVEYDRLERLSSQLGLLYILQMFAFKVKILQISVANLREQLQKSEMFEKTNEIEAAKKDVEKLKILLEAQYELIRQIGEGRKEDLFYIS